MRSGRVGVARGNRAEVCAQARMEDVTGYSGRSKTGLRGILVLAGRRLSVRRGFSVKDEVPFYGAQISSPRHSCRGGRRHERRRTADTCQKLDAARW